jgi:dUTP pyrophosphatase
MSDKITIRYKKLHKDAKPPKQAKDGDAGYDLFALEPTTLNPFERKAIKTGIAIEIPKGYYGRIAPRSGLAVKDGIDVLAGVVDAGYRDGVGVVLINLNVLEWLTLLFTNPKDAFQAIFGVKGLFKVDPNGKAVAQLIIEKCHEVEWVEAEELSSSERGTGGYGSTDKK